MEYLVFSYVFLLFWPHNTTFCNVQSGASKEMASSNTLFLLYVLIVIVAMEILNLISKRKEIHCMLVTKHASNEPIPWLWNPGHTLPEVQNTANSGNRINHWSMNWRQFKDHVSHMCLAGAVVASWSLMQEVAGSIPFTVMTNISHHCIQWKHLGKVQVAPQKRTNVLHFFLKNKNWFLTVTRYRLTLQTHQTQIGCRVTGMIFNTKTVSCQQGDSCEALYCLEIIGNSDNGSYSSMNNRAFSLKVNYSFFISSNTEMRKRQVQRKRIYYIQYIRCNL